MGKAQKEKGKRGERELAKALKYYGYYASRGVQYKGSENSPDVIGLPGIHIEVKRVERLNIYDAISQAQADAGENNLPAVFHRKNNCKWLVTMTLDDWINVYRAWEVGNNEMH